jgi:hypothetical protein
LGDPVETAKWSEIGAVASEKGFSSHDKHCQNQRNLLAGIHLCGISTKKHLVAIRAASHDSEQRQSQVSLFFGTVTLVAAPRFQAMFYGTLQSRPTKLDVYRAELSIANLQAGRMLFKTARQIRN